MEQINGLVLIGVWLSMYFVIGFVGRKLFPRNSIEMNSEVATLLAAIIAVFSSRRDVINHPVEGVVIAVCLFGLVRFFAKRKLKNGRVNWSPLESIGVVGFIFFFSQLLVLSMLQIAKIAQGWRQVQAVQDWLESSIGAQFLLTLLIELLSVSLLIWFIRKRGSGLSAIGLSRGIVWKDVGLALVGYGCYFLGYIVLATVIQALFPQIDPNQQQQIGFENAQGLALVPVFISLVILPPIAEELLFRGFLYSGLRQKLHKIWAVAITSALFAVAHLQAGSGAPLLWIAAIDTFVLSVVLIELKERSNGRLWAPMLLHMLKNLVAFVGLFVLHIAK